VTIRNSVWSSVRRFNKLLIIVQDKTSLTPCKVTVSFLSRVIIQRMQSAILFYQCPSVCPSSSGTLSKRMEIVTFLTKQMSKGNPLSGGLNIRG